MNRWRTLCHRYLDRQRASYADLLRRFHDPPLAEGEIASLTASHAGLAAYLELRSGGTLATADDLDHFRRPSPEEVFALKELFTDICAMHFVKALTQDAEYAPVELVAEMVKGAVYTVNPSANREWLERIVPVAPTQVFRALFRYLERGTAFEVGGAVNAFYWFDVFASQLGLDLRFRAERRAICLRRFVETEDLDLRRCLVGRISWEASDYASALRPLLEKARTIARSHPDDYIRKRFLYDTGQSAVIPCLPHRDLTTVV